MPITNSIAETTDPDLVEIVFMPRLNDVVEFLSDKQTEKGPSSGYVKDCNYKTGMCEISHSDTIETFKMADLKVRKYVRHRNHDDRRPYWALV